MNPSELYSEIQPFVQLEIQNFTSDRKYDIAQIPAHVHNGTDSSNIDFANINNRTRYLFYRIVAPTTVTAVANSVGGSFVMPFNGYITSAGATVDTAGTTNTTTIRVNKNTVTIFLTNITIDSTKTSSRTSTTQSVLNNTKVNFITGDIFTFDVTAISTTPAQGLTVFLNITES